MLAPSLVISEMCPNPFSAIVWDTGSILLSVIISPEPLVREPYGHVFIHKRTLRAILAIRKLLTVMLNPHGGIAL